MIVDKILQKAHSGGSLITATVLTALGGKLGPQHQHQLIPAYLITTM